MKNNFLMDLHCHLDLYQDFEAAVAESERERIRTITVTTTPRAWPRNREVTKKNKFVRPALGLHPQLIGPDVKDELSLWEKYLPEARYVGEIGLDAGPRFFHTFGEQQKVLGRMLRLCSEMGGKILSIHSVRSASAVLDLIESNTTRNRVGIILHWFTGRSAEAQRAIKLGSYFSVNTQMLHTRGGRQLMETLPLERILTETDRPFTKSGSQPNRERELESLVKALSEIRKIDSVAMGQQIMANLKNVLTAVHSQ